MPAVGGKSVTTVVGQVCVSSLTVGDRQTVVHTRKREDSALGY